VSVERLTINEVIFPLPLIFHEDDPIPIGYGYDPIGILRRCDLAKNGRLADISLGTYRVNILTLYVDKRIKSESWRRIFRPRSLAFYKSTYKIVYCPYFAMLIFEQINVTVGFSRTSFNVLWPISLSCIL